MNTVSLRTNAAYKENESKKTLKQRIADYFEENWSTMAMGMYALSGRMPDVEFLRSINVL